MTETSKMSSDGHLTLSPKMSFILGMVGGIMLLCTIGFFILLSVVLNSTSSSVVADANDNGIIPSVPAAQAQVNDPVVLAPISADDRVWGSDSSPVTLVEYSDVECPFCSQFQNTINQIQDNYVGKVKIVYRHFPLSFHPQAIPAALASECAGDQDMFWEYLDELFANNGSLGSTLYSSVAKKLGLNISKFEKCLEDEDFKDKINTDRASGVAAGISGTPGSIIVAADGTMTEIPGALPFDQVSAMLDSVLN